MRRITRRDFLRASALSLGAVVISKGLSGCLSSNDSAPSVRFDHGVASGDPQQQSVILWTRITPEDPAVDTLRVSWEVATDSRFDNIVRSGGTTVERAHDYTLKVDAQGLLPGQIYHYRFRAESGLLSPQGRTRTLPETNVDQVRFAVVSCSNYPAGFFHAYAEIAREPDLDALLHLGDYLYEYDNRGYATGDAENLGRLLPEDNDVELLTLADYRKRYAVYHQDPDSQAVHAALPLIAVWDDHEIANDAWREGAENHDRLTQGDFTERKLAALQAYFEWLPIRPVRLDDRETIFRSFHYGHLVSLYMLDTRIIGRDEQLSYADFLTQTGLNGPAFVAAVGDVNRTLLGMEQRNWLQQQMGASSSTWQVLGQQVLFGRMTLPAELLLDILNPDASTLLPKFAELAQIKGRLLQGDPSLTDAQKSRVETVLPYNLDAWDGYAAEREVILGTARALGKNLVVLSGDTHNAWANDLRDRDGNPGGVEFATPSVSSPGLEEYLSLPEEAVTDAEQAIQLLVDDLQYLNVNQRGYLVVTFTPDEARADWRFVSTVKNSEYTVDSTRAAAMRMLAGARQLDFPNPVGP
jgi:alkaline phosphatase D